jgi:geranylgeranyl diphosphate synthase type I
MSITIQQAMLAEIENELKRQVARLDQPPFRLFHEMLAYHMGWSGEGAGTQAAGKRVRPLLLLLSAQVCIEAKEINEAKGTNWLHAVPAAASVELIHNFSLVHDDIQDNSPLRRGRQTAWVKWGAPMAINIGDALFVIANQAMLDLRRRFPAESVVRAAAILNDCCLRLTQGQYLDMSFEGRADVNMEDYWKMIDGKTSALLSACTSIGALLGYAKDDQVNAFAHFGHHLGRAFQVLDDILGIWGDEALTGKSAASDLLEGKNSLPVLFALEQGGRFAERWKQGPIRPDEVAEIASLLEREGAKAHAQSAAEAETQKALAYLDQAGARGEAGVALLELADLLLKRRQ